MNSEVGEKYTSELIRLFQQRSISLYNGHHSLCLTVPCLQYLQRQFLQLQETSGGPVPASLASYRQLQEHFSRIQSLKLIMDRRSPPLLRTSNLTLNLEPFRALQALILKKIPLNLVIGLQRLRGQLHVLIIQRCDVAELDDVIVRCGGDNSTSLAWSSLRELDLSNNLIRKLGDSLQYLHCLEKVNFSNNQIGKRPRVLLSGDSSGTGSSVEGSINYGSVAVVRPNQEQSREAEVATEGIEVKVEFNRYPPQKFLGELRTYLNRNTPPGFKLDLKWELVDREYEEELQQAFYAQEHPYGYRENSRFPSLRGDHHCPHCLCTPCIISLPPDYLRGSCSPHDANDEKRYTLYRKFWRTLKGLGLWQDEGYLRRKEMRTVRDDKRDIIPDCVIKLLTSVQDWDEFHDFLHIPDSKYDAIKHHYPDTTARVRALCGWFLTNHPAPSWDVVANGLYCCMEHALLDVVRRHYLKGTKQSRDLLREAMNDGRVQSHISKILLYGAAGTGKSSFMDLVIDNPPATLRRSTSLAARPVAIFHVGMAGQQWEKLSPQQQKEVLVKAAVRKSIKDDQEGESSSEEENIGSDVEQTGEEGVPVSSEANSTQHQASAQNTGAEASSAAPSAQDQTSQPSQQDTPDSTPDTTFDNLVLLAAEYSKTGESITTYRKLYLVDSGGQPQFHEMLPVFLRRMTLYVFVFKLSEELSTKPMVEYYDQSGEPVGTPYQSSHTNQQLLEHCLRTLRTHRPSPDSQTKSSKIMIIGTHRDKEKFRKRAQKNKILSQLLLPSFQEEAVLYKMKEMIFPVNARRPKKKDRLVVQHFRDLVWSECTPEPVDVPLRYYALEIVLEEYSQKVGRGVLSIDECLEAASELQFERHTLEAALTFLDELSAVFYFPEILEGVLFTNPQVLLDKVTELVEMVHALRKDCNTPLACVREMLAFRDYAEISFTFLSKQEFRKHYVSGLFTPVELVRLFRQLFIIAELSSEKFFMPALLPVLEEAKLAEYSVPANSPVATLTVSFEQGPRLGVYCTLSCFLVSSENTFPSPWKIKLIPKSTTPFCLYRNCIRFSIPGCSGSVTLVDTFTHFEVHVSTQKKEECVKVCSFVRSGILAGLKKASATLGYLDLTPSLCLLCPCKEYSDVHVAMFGEDCWICSLDSELTGDLTPRQLIWIETSFNPKGRLTENDFDKIMECLGQYSYEWKRIGTSLGFTPAELSTIEATPMLLSGAPRSYLSTMLFSWLQWAPRDGRGSRHYATIQDLKRAVDKAGLGVVAQDLQRALQ